MKYLRKCPCCNRIATKRVGKLDFCDDCAKEVRKNKSKYIWHEKYVCSFSPRCRIYTDYLIKVY